MSTAPTEAASKLKLDVGQIALKKINDGWKGNTASAAAAAALDIGMLNAGNLLSYENAKDAVLRGLAVRSVDEKWWSTVHGSFQSVPANDNTKDDSINAETLLGMDFAPLEADVAPQVVAVGDEVNAAAE